MNSELRTIYVMLLVCHAHVFLIISCIHKFVYGHIISCLLCTTRVKILFLLLFSTTIPKSFIILMIYTLDSIAVPYQWLKEY